ncbi:hypothetical protein GCM10009661_48190 [Catellatospora chokoriensis]|uniref:Uncharacterized protein n=1 Tax=Catellatospora chokoriensis TaxID=310353 RepID=A0A8J3K474_9ACTN|nr:hypothetical protein Cch02nite_60320 [Catellatospora chokoriensis]
MVEWAWEVGRDAPMISRSAAAGAIVLTTAACPAAGPAREGLPGTPVDNRAVVDNHPITRPVC